ncbi:hypothetical protein LTS08_005262 [Lithohypha guttulata]|nr:hypothetical protein LTS08_005262 [Lithohypha guttulata]
MDTSAAINDLKHAFENRSFFQLGDREVLGLLHSAYYTEISYLTSAYFAGCPAATSPRTRSPSEVLYGTKYPEVDRTLTGLLALRWIEKNAYHYFTQNQSSSTRLRYESFKELREYFHAHTRRFMNHDIVFTLVTMQVTNDLGKSAQLKIDLEGHLPRGVPVSSNHDMMMLQILELDQSAKLIPSFSHLRPDLRNAAYESIHLSAGFNPGQLVQGECAPAALTILTKLNLSERDLHLKFMELFLDVAGARGHVSHEGSLTMTEACYQGYCLVRDVSLKVASGAMSPWEAYKAVLRSKTKALQQSGWRVPKGFDLARDAAAIAKTRIFCMARVIDAETADLINCVYENLTVRIREALEEGLCRYGTVDRPAVQPTYMPAMFANLKSHAHPAHAFAALLTYLAQVLTLTRDDLAQLEPGTVIVERDVREILENCMRSDMFLRDPHAVVNASTSLPALQVLQKTH